MAQDLAGVAAIELPTKNVVIDIRIISTGDRPSVQYTMEGSIPLMEDEAPLLNEIGKPMYRPSAASWNYTRYIDDPDLVVQLLTSATVLVLGGAGAVDLYTGIEETATSLEARLIADDLVSEADPRRLRDVVRTGVQHGEALLTQFGIPF